MIICYWRKLRKQEQSSSVLENMKTAAGCHSFAVVSGSDGSACMVPRKANTTKDRQLPNFIFFKHIGSSTASPCCQTAISAVGRAPVLYTASHWFDSSIAELSRKNYKPADCESISAMGKHLETGAFLHLQKINKKVY